MTDNIIAKIINEFINSDKMEDKIFIASVLKELGKFGQRLYKLNPTEELKNSILKINLLIKNL